MRNRPRSTRHSVPRPAALGLNTGQRTIDDLTELGWYSEDSLELLWGLAGAADPNLALLNILRLRDALNREESSDGAETSWAAVDQALRDNVIVRTRMFALLGGSAALGDHLIANPSQWVLLQADLPSTSDMYRQLLTSVQARPEVPQLAAETEAAEEDLDADYPTTPSEDLEGPGLYRAGITGAEAEKAMRRSYRDLILRIAAADLAGTYPKGPRRDGQPEVPFEIITRSLSDLADAALTAALSVAVATVYPSTPVSTRLAVLAMGKCGARELNYISDVDVIFVAEPADTIATRLASEFIKISSKCFFEVDAALRPEGKSGALVRTLESHEKYYQRWAETWEFQAQLKARPMTGDLDLGRAYVDKLEPMVWEASQRESFVEDVQAMRRRVIDNVPKQLQMRELKLGVGGLRDVEFAVQLLQLVHGRYDESLRVLSTVEALRALVAGGYVGREDGSSLIADYEFMRLLEHRLQLQKLRRTHTLPEEQDTQARNWLARAAGLLASESATSPTPPADALDKRVRATAKQIRSLHNKLFYRPLLNSVVEQDIGTMQLSSEAAKRQLAALGYKFPDRAFEHLVVLASGTSRKARIQAMLLPTLMEWLSATQDPDAGLLNYRKLSEVLYGQQWFLRTLRDEGIVGQRLMKILGNSPYAADLLMASPDTIRLLGDGAAGPKLLDTDPEKVGKSLVVAASRHDDPQRASEIARGLRRSELARIASADLLGMMEVPEVCASLSKVWNNVLEAALSAEIRGWCLQHPEEDQPASIAVIGMGRLGGAELGYGSDADVMFVCEPLIDDETAAVRWAGRICDAMRRRLAKPSGDPPLSVDVDLRPEGRSGAVVRTLQSYINYYQRWGETWEMQALLRATFIAGDEELGEKFLTAIDPLRYPENGADAQTVMKVRRMKARVDNERLPRGANRRTHTKLGSGALTDIEWTVQLLILLHAHESPQLHNTSTLECLDVLEETQILEPVDVERLRTAWLTATKARNAIVLTRGKRADELPQPGPYLAQVAAAAGWDPQDSGGFMEDYLRATRRARRVVERVFWGEESPTRE